MWDPTTNLDTYCRYMLQHHTKFLSARAQVPSKAAPCLQPFSWISQSSVTSHTHDVLHSCLHILNMNFDIERGLDPHHFYLGMQKIMMNLIRPSIYEAIGYLFTQTVSTNQKSNSSKQMLRSVNAANMMFWSNIVCLLLDIRLSAFSEQHGMASVCSPLTLNLVLSKHQHFVRWTNLLGRPTLLLGFCLSLRQSSALPCFQPQYFHLSGQAGGGTHTHTWCDV